METLRQTRRNRHKGTQKKKEKGSQFIETLRYTRKKCHKNMKKKKEKGSLKQHNKQ